MDTKCNYRPHRPMNGFRCDYYPPQGLAYNSRSHDSVYSDYVDYMCVHLSRTAVEDAFTRMLVCGEDFEETFLFPDFLILSIEFALLTHRCVDFWKAYGYPRDIFMDVNQEMARRHQHD